MEPPKKKLKLDIGDFNYKFQNLTLKRKNDNTYDEKKIKKVKFNFDKNEKKRKIDLGQDKVKLKSCSQEYAEYNKKYNKENNNDPDNNQDNELSRQFKRLPDDDLIYRYII